MKNKFTILFTIRRIIKNEEENSEFQKLFQLTKSDDQIRSISIKKLLLQFFYHILMDCYSILHWTKCGENPFEYLNVVHDAIKGFNWKGEKHFKF